MTNTQSTSKGDVVTAVSAAIFCVCTVLAFAASFDVTPSFGNVAAAALVGVVGAYGAGRLPK